MAEPYFPGEDEPVITKDGYWTRRYLVWWRRFRMVGGTVSAAAAVWSTVGGIATWRSLLSILPAGTIVQVVVGTTTTPASSGSATYAATGLSVAMTPQAVSSQILVLALQNGCRKSGADTGLQIRLRRGSTTIGQLAAAAGATGAADLNDMGTIAGAVLDAPATTSPITYSTQFANSAGSGTVNVQANNELSALVAVEVLG